MNPGIFLRPFSGPFRFCDLPGEIRNKIYYYLLCDIDPPSGFYDDIDFLSQVEHDLDLEILRTSKEIYREAYDVMVKTNRFVKVTTGPGVPIKTTLSALRAPIVTDIDELVNDFKGYVMSIHLCLGEEPVVDGLSPSYDSDYEPQAIMILHRDLDKLCGGINKLDTHTPGFRNCLKISIEMAPVLDTVRDSSISPSFKDFFSQNMQETLVAPLRAHLQGYKRVEVKGHVDVCLATALRKDLGKDRYSDPEAVLARITAAKEEGVRLFQARQVQEAWLKCQDTVVEVDALVGSSSWSSLVLQGKENFVSQLANVYFLMRLDTIQIQQFQWHNNPPAAFHLAKESIDHAYESLEKDYWMKGFQYIPSAQHLAQLPFRYAALLRLARWPGTENLALEMIDQALQLQPRDPDILREKERIKLWIRDGSYQEDEHPFNVWRPAGPRIIL